MTDNGFRHLFQRVVRMNTEFKMNEFRYSLFRGIRLNKWILYEFRQPSFVPGSVRTDDELQNE